MSLKGGGDLTLKNECDGFSKSASRTKIETSIFQWAYRKMAICIGKSQQQKAGGPQKCFERNASWHAQR